MRGAVGDEASDVLADRAATPRRPAASAIAEQVLLALRYRRSARRTECRAGPATRGSRGLIWATRTGIRGHNSARKSTIGPKPQIPSRVGRRRHEQRRVDRDRAQPGEDVAVAERQEVSPSRRAAFSSGVMKNVSTRQSRIGEIGPRVQAGNENAGEVIAPSASPARIDRLGESSDSPEHAADQRRARPAAGPRRDRRGRGGAEPCDMPGHFTYLWKSGLRLAP